MKNLLKILTISYLLCQQGIKLHAQSPNEILSQLINTETQNRPQLLQKLGQQKAVDYSSTDKVLLAQVLAADSLYGYDTVLRVAGQVGVGKAKIKAFSSSSTDPTLKATAKLALARIGDEALATELMKNVIEIPVNDEFVYHVAPILVYVRQPETFDYLFDLILSDEKNCTSPNPDVSTPMTCAYRLVEMTAPYVIDYPVKVGSSGDLETDDYPAALTKVRQWIIKHREDYELDRGTL